MNLLKDFVYELFKYFHQENSHEISDFTIRETKKATTKQIFSKLALHQKIQ